MPGGAHPLYHYFASLLGIRPASAGFEQVSIQPQLAGLTEIYGIMPHPKGEIEADLHLVSGHLTGVIRLPIGVTGQFEYGEQKQILIAGENMLLFDS